MDAKDKIKDRFNNLIEDFIKENNIRLDEPFHITETKKDKTETIGTFMFTKKNNVYKLTRKTGKFLESPEKTLTKLLYGQAETEATLPYVYHVTQLTTKLVTQFMTVSGISRQEVGVTIFQNIEEAQRYIKTVSLPMAVEKIYEEKEETLYEEIKKELIENAIKNCKETKCGNDTIYRYELSSYNSFAGKYITVIIQLQKAFIY